MTILLMVIAIAASAFLFGFLLGILNEPSEKPIKAEKKQGRPDLNEESESLQKEYKNFLQYDGSEQA